MPPATPLRCSSEYDPYLNVCVVWIGSKLCLGTIVDSPSGWY
jgi:hypothetical protein